VQEGGFQVRDHADVFHLGRRTLIGDPNSGLPKWQDNIYIALSGLGIDPSTYFKLPANRVVEIGEQVTI
jgi:KUP system potassium uptake protein